MAELKLYAVLSVEYVEEKVRSLNVSDDNIEHVPARIVRAPTAFEAVSIARRDTFHRTYCYAINLSEEDTYEFRPALPETIQRIRKEA